MTGYTVHTGSTEKFADGWDRIFASGKKSDGKDSGQAKSAKQSGKKPRGGKKTS